MTLDDGSVPVAFREQPSCPGAYRGRAPILIRQGELRGGGSRRQRGGSWEAQWQIDKRAADKKAFDENPAFLHGIKLHAKGRRQKGGKGVPRGTDMPKSWMQALKSNNQPVTMAAAGRRQKGGIADGRYFKVPPAEQRCDGPPDPTEGEQCRKPRRLGPPTRMPPTPHGPVVGKGRVCGKRRNPDGTIGGEPGGREMPAKGRGAKRAARGAGCPLDRE